MRSCSTSGRRPARGSSAPSKGRRPYSGTVRSAGRRTPASRRGPAACSGHWPGYPATTSRRAATRPGSRRTSGAAAASSSSKVSSCPVLRCCPTHSPTAEGGRRSVPVERRREVAKVAWVDPRYVDLDDLGDLVGVGRAEELEEGAHLLRDRLEDDHRLLLGLDAPLPEVA